MCDTINLQILNFITSSHFSELQNVKVCFTYSRTHENTRNKGLTINNIQNCENGLVYVKLIFLLCFSLKNDIKKLRETYTEKERELKNCTDKLYGEYQRSYQRVQRCNQMQMKTR